MSDLITISAERLKELEALEASIPSMIEKAIVEYKKSNLKKLHERDKANPAAINMRVKRYVERHREEINQKRREKRRLQKLQQQQQQQQTCAESQTVPVPPTVNMIVDESLASKVESIYVRAANTAISNSDNPIVRKQYKKRKQSDLTDSDAPTPSVSATVPDLIHDITVRFDT